ncbi:hypothetical protein ATANTOWER_002785 [Ataeniobius toweri]|uniref:Uncharacterized protein n=1 Tax=Ataeniobius toweri TaxID=208326 RepID=A0ABU7AVS2_9TELE|nr:hypothetical protein [Ataeniobius toweri]
MSWRSVIWSVQMCDDTDLKRECILKSLVIHLITDPATLIKIIWFLFQRPLECRKDDLRIGVSGIWTIFTPLFSPF